MKEEVKQLIETYEEYIKLFQQENNDLMGLNIAHGYRGNEENYKKGIELRERIKNLKELLKTQ